MDQPTLHRGSVGCAGRTGRAGRAGCAESTARAERTGRAGRVRRAGRAGRTSGGTCLRLWSEAEQESRAPRDEAEVKRVDLSESLHILAEAGISKPDEFPWFESPLPKALTRARELLVDLSALDC